MYRIRYYQCSQQHRQDNKSIRNGAHRSESLLCDVTESYSPRQSPGIRCISSKYTTVTVGRSTSFWGISEDDRKVIWRATEIPLYVDLSNINRQTNNSPSLDEMLLKMEVKSNNVLK